MIMSKAAWVAVTLMCQVSYKTKGTQLCYLTMSEVSKTEKECKIKRRVSEKCVEFKEGEFMIIYNTQKRKIK